jgi:tRNA-2-methylthio-N6-dimethylallyladenosine synthase
VEIVRKLRQARPEIGITTDLIVGFPGETEADFEDTLKLADTIEFDNAYVYKYSPRRDTPAADLPDQLSDEVKEARHARLLERINAIAQKRYDAFIGQTVDVLVEGPSRRNSARWTGRSGCTKIVLFDAAQRQRGEFLPIRIERTGKFTLYGQPVGASR